MAYIDTLTKALDLLISYESQSDSIRSIVNPILSTILILFALGYIASKLNLERWFNHIEQKKSRKIQLLNEAIICKTNSKELQDIATDILQANYFKEAANIYAENHKRNQLINLHKKTNGQFSWDDIKLSLKYAEFESINITYKKFRWHHKVGYYFNKTMGISSAVFSFFILILIGLLYASQNLTIQTGFTLFMQMCFIFSLGLLYLRSNWPYNAAKKISECLATQGDSV
nr:hypothetical protein [uncultured Tolumonas sp.]